MDEDDDDKAQREDQENEDSANEEPASPDEPAQADDTPTDEASEGDAAEATEPLEDANDDDFGDVFAEDEAWEDDSYWDFEKLSSDIDHPVGRSEWSLNIEPSSADREMLARITSEPGLWIVPDMHDKERELLMKWLSGMAASKQIYCAHPMEGARTSEMVLLSQMVGWHNEQMTVSGPACYVVDPHEHSIFISDTEMANFLAELKKAGISILLFSRGNSHASLKNRGATPWRPDFYSYWWRCFTEAFFEAESSDVVEDEFERATGLLETKRSLLLGRTPTRAKILRLRRLILDSPEIPDRESDLGDVIQQVMDAFEARPSSDGSRLREAHNEVFRISPDQMTQMREKGAGKALLEPEATALFVAWNCLKNNDGKPIQLMDFEEIFSIQLRNLETEQKAILANAARENPRGKSKKKDRPDFDAGQYLRHRLFASQGDMMLEYIGLDVNSSPVKGKQIAFRHPDLLDHLDDIFSRRRANYAAAQIDRFFVDQKIWEDGQSRLRAYANMLMVLKFRQYGPISDPNVAMRCVDEILKDFKPNSDDDLPTKASGRLAEKRRYKVLEKRYLRVVEFIMLWFDEQQKLAPDTVEETARAFKDFVTLLSKQLMKRGGWLDFVFLFMHIARHRPELIDVSAILRKVNERAPFATKWDILSIVETEARKQTGNELQYRIFRFLVSDITKTVDDNQHLDVFRDAFLAGLALRVIPAGVRRLTAADYEEGSPQLSDAMLEQIITAKGGITDLVTVMTAPRVRNHLQQLLSRKSKNAVLDKFALQEFMRIEEMCYAMQIKPLERAKDSKSNQKSHEDFHEDLYRTYMKEVREVTTLVENLPVFNRFNTRNMGGGAVGTARARVFKMKRGGAEWFIPILRAHFEDSKHLESLNSLNLLVFVELHGALLGAGRTKIAEEVLKALNVAQAAAVGVEERREIRAFTKGFDARLTAAKLVQKRGLVAMVKNTLQELKMGKISQEYCTEFDAYLRRRYGFIDNFTLVGTSVRRTE